MSPTPVAVDAGLGGQPPSVGEARLCADSLAGMATNEERPALGPELVFEGLTFATLPEGTRAEAVFALVKLNAEAGGGEDDGASGRLATTTDWSSLGN